MVSATVLGGLFGGPVGLVLGLTTSLANVGLNYSHKARDYAYYQQVESRQSAYTRARAGDAFIRARVQSK